ncbi:MAG: DUF6456 domain-containing protein [Alphaproteobacteria bacterium]|nr:DUF6456 domain-containing protein [Alphaproteobacteria bacterium]
MKIKYVIDKAEAKRKGYHKNSRGTYINKSVLDKYYEQGYLDLSGSEYCAEDRKQAGERLAHDYYLSHYNSLKSPILAVNIIPTTGESGMDVAMFFRERYINALRHVPYEFWPVVRLVCIEDKELKGDDECEKKTLRSKNSIFYKKMLLNLGLDRLFKFYSKKIEKSS